MYLCRYSSEHNQKAKRYLLQHLSNKFSNTYSPRKIKRKSQFFSLLPFLVYLCITIFCALSTCVYCQESHLSAGSMLCVVLHSYLSTVKMCHLSAVPCQDVSSFGRKHVVCCVMYSNTVKMTLCA